MITESANHTAAEPMYQWVIYENPRDFPGSFVVRQWAIRRSGEIVPGAQAFVCQSLEIARARIPSGLFRIPRQPDDDATIVEVWI